ncbi:MAG: hypothetical protein Q9211_001425 [Gyalolechia sp. 1 TL-2023]
MALLRADGTQAAQEAQSHPSSSQPAPAPSPVHAQAVNDAEAVNGRKRPSPSDEGPKKRHKNNKSRDDRTPRAAKPTEGQVVMKTGDRRSPSSSALSDLDEKQEKPVDKAEGGEKMVQITAEPGSESELSVLIDEEPKPKKRARKAGSKKPKSGKEGSKPAKAPQQLPDPDSEKIKRLQGWLVKCGIRKMWFRELAPYDTSKAKIRHLEAMLTDAGMTGRYSQEKATQIREERELKADLEAVKAGNEQWGKVESDGDGGGRPRGKVARGLEELDFLKDEDGDESD